MDKGPPSQTQYPPINRFFLAILENPGRAAAFLLSLLLIYQACLPGGLTLNPDIRTINLTIIPSADFSTVLATGGIYWLYGHFVFCASWRVHEFLPRAIIFTLLATALMGLGVELVEYFNEQRSSSVWEMLTSAIAGIFAIFSGLLYSVRYSFRISCWLKKLNIEDPVKVIAFLLALFIVIQGAKPYDFINSVEGVLDNLKQSHFIPYRPSLDDVPNQLINQGAALSSIHYLRLYADYLAHQITQFLWYLALFSLLLYGRQRSQYIPQFSFGLFIVITSQVVGFLNKGSLFDISYLTSGLFAIVLALLINHLLLNKPGIALLGLLTIFSSSLVLTELHPVVFSNSHSFTINQLIPFSQVFSSASKFSFLNIALASMPVAMALYSLIIYLRKNKTLDSTNSWPSSILTILYCGLLATGIEVVQIWHPVFAFRTEDILFATIGALFGVWLLQAIVKYSSPFLRPNANYDSKSETVIKIYPDSDYLKVQIPETGIIINELPFRIGREIDLHETAPKKDIHLKLVDRHPLQLSRDHFLLDRNRKGVYLRDCDSHYGTYVNDILIGNAGRHGKMVHLKNGENRIIAGEHDSRFQFIIEVSSN